MSDEVILDPDSIASRSWGVAHVFQELISHVKDCNVDSEIPGLESSVGDLLDRFKLWAGNMGAFHGSQSRMSLEKRLVESPELRDQIYLDLGELKEAIEEFSVLCLSNGDMSGAEAGSERGEDDDNDIENTDSLRDDQLLEEFMDDLNFGLSELSKAEQIQKMLEFLSECIKALFNLGILVRRSTPQDRFQRALQHSNEPVNHMIDTTYVQDKYRKLGTNDSQWLAMRLGTANAKRRQVINYGRRHQEKLQAPEPDPVMQQQVGLEADNVVASGIHDHSSEQASSKATTFVLPVDTTSSQLLDLAPIEEETDDAISMVTATTAWGSEKVHKLPSLSSLSPDGEPFECPICFTFQTFRTEKGWKIHAYRDLKAYVCTVRGDSCKNDLFSERDSWFEHELRNHRSLHRCKLCGAQFPTDVEIRAHVISSHQDSGGDHLDAIIQGEKVVPSQIAAKDCPFCNDWAVFLENRAESKGKSTENGGEKPAFMVSTVRFKRHVASHQEQLAIFALPRSILTDTTESDDGSFGSNASVANIHGSDVSASNESGLNESEGPEDPVQLPSRLLLHQQWVKFVEFVQGHEKPGQLCDGTDAIFVSPTVCKNYWSRERFDDMLNTLPPQQWNTDHSYFLRRWVIIFSILVYIGPGIDYQIDAIQKLGLHGIDDASLPFQQPPAGLVPIVDSNEEHFWSRFLDVQWRFLPLPLNQIRMKPNGHGELIHARTILPVTKPRMGRVPIGYKGSTSTRIVFAYPEFMPTMNEVNEQDSHIMLTTYPPRANKDYHRAVDSLSFIWDNFEQIPDGSISHLVQYMGGFGWLDPDNQEHHILMTEAAPFGSLLEMFHSNRAPSGFDEIKIFWKSMLGVLRGLATLHEGFSLVHVDLKPANIHLCHSNRRDSPFDKKLKITGLDQLYYTTDRPIIRNPGYTRTYDAPTPPVEPGSSGRDFVNNKVDIWAIGCIFVEAAVWLYAAEDGRDKFRLDRAGEIERGGLVLGDCFHDGFFLLKCVEDVPDMIARMGPTDNFTMRVVHCVLNGVLRRRPKERLSARNLLENLEIALATAHDPPDLFDKTYPNFTGFPRPLDGA